MAQTSVAKAQKQQMRRHDKASKNASFMVGERVFLCMPAMKTGAHRKLSCPFKGPYRVTALHPNGAEIRLVGKPLTESIRVALNRLRRCPTEIEGNPLPEQEATLTGTLELECTHRDALEQESTPRDPSEQGDPAKNTLQPSSTWSTRLRSRKK